MLEATIKAVKEAEHSASAVEEAARGQADAVIEQTRADARQNREHKINELSVKRKQQMGGAKAEGKKELESVMQEVELKIKELKETASSREKKVVEQIICELIL